MTTLKVLILRHGSYISVDERTWRLVVKPRPHFILQTFCRLSFSLLLVSVASGTLGVTRLLAEEKIDKRQQLMDREWKRLQTEKDPADRAESYMKIADLALAFTSDAARVNDLPRMESYLTVYSESVSKARDGMMTSGLDPYKKSKGYKLIETGVRKQLRIMQDIARTLNLQARKPIEGVIGVASKVRDEVLHALFR